MVISPSIVAPRAIAMLPAITLPRMTALAAISIFLRTTMLPVTRPATPALSAGTSPSQCASPEICSSPPMLPSPRTWQPIISAPGVSMSPVTREPLANSDSAPVGRSRIRRFGLSLTVTIIRLTKRGERDEEHRNLSDGHRSRRFGAIGLQPRGRGLEVRDHSRYHGGLSAVPAAAPQESQRGTGAGAHPADRRGSRLAGCGRRRYPRCLRTVRGPARGQQMGAGSAYPHRELRA